MIILSWLFLGGCQDDAMGRVTRNQSVLRLGPQGAQRRSDRVAVEEPLEIRINGEAFVVTMRTPGDDIDMVHGLLHSEGVIREAADIRLARYCAGSGPDGVNTYNVIDVSLADGLAPAAAAARRSVVTTSACGICGATSIDQVLRQSRYPPTEDLRVPAALIRSSPVLLRGQQRAFAKTGGLHAAGLLSLDGAMSCVREDVGRHNAVDKVVGWAIRQGRLPLSETILVVSGRASYELTQKAVLAGIPVLAAVSAPSSLAVDLAADAGVTLLGFVRGESMNVYTHPERILLDESQPGSPSATIQHDAERAMREAASDATWGAGVSDGYGT
jgi:FdhD protein